MVHEEIDPLSEQNFFSYAFAIDNFGTQLSSLGPFLLNLQKLTTANTLEPLRSFFDSLDETTNRPANTLLAFARQVEEYLSDNFPSTTPGTSTSDTVFYAFINTWTLMTTGSQTFAENNAILNTTISSLQSRTWFKHFIETLEYDDGKINLNQFVDALRQQLVLTATLVPHASPLYFEETTLPFTDSFQFITTQNPNVQLPDYQTTFFSYFPNAKQEDFVTRLQAFYQEKLGEHGYFIPSQFYNEWRDNLLFDYIQSKDFYLKPIFDNTSLAGGNYNKTIVINKIYSLIALLLNTMQRVAFFQAKRLSILTQWQRVYTDVISSLHVFTTGDKTTLTDEDTRTKINTQINQNYRDTMQTARSIIGDDAKALQSNINQTNDAVTQQANMATALIQELNTILGTIFR